MNEVENKQNYAVVCDKVSFSYASGFAVSREFILKKLSLKVSRGQLVIIKGPSGSGKSTLLNLLGGLLQAVEGTVSVSGRSLSSMKDRELSEFRRDNIGFIFQEPHLDKKRSVLQNVMLPLYFGRRSLSEGRAGALKLLKELNMQDYLNKPVSELSGGQKQRIAAARALLNSPSLLLADEPFAHLDRENALGLTELIGNLRESCGNTVIMTSHMTADEAILPKDAVILNIKELQAD
ncbi:ATP-binding cassette domain-containing protein [bacterium]|nr:ATP-binding cassette domain-containing protein [bacterium]